MASHIIAGLDIGTHSLKMAVARKKEDGEIEILGLAQEASAGVRKGSVVNPEKLSSQIFALKQRIENLSTHKISSAFVNIGGSHISLTSSHGTVAVSRADGQISKEDIERVLSAAQTFPPPSNNEVLKVFPQQFTVDGVKGIKDVRGMRGMRLEVDVLAVLVFGPYLKNLTEAVLNSDIEIRDIVPSPLMASSAVLTPKQKELGVCLVDLGAGTTGIAVFQEGELIHIAVFPVGSDNITNDIAVGLRCDHDLAERIKKEFGNLGGQIGRRIERIETPDSGSLTFSLKTLSRIIEARMHEIFQFINKELKKIGQQGTLPAGAVLVGGGSKLPKLVDFAKRELKLPAKLGSLHGIAAPEIDPIFFGVMGLVQSGFESGEEGVVMEFSQGLLQKIKNFLKVFIP